ncbi:hypothetical protein C8R44DRAFT_727488 [Mycena epipterygia]|nr:hypothetical protein C8R44DRAFT_727488 [Mycena epipterygia]
MAPRKIKLPADKMAIAEELGQRLYHYESSTEAHTSALSADPVGYSAAYKQYASLSPDPLGTLPPPSDLDRCIIESEKLLSKTCVCPFDHLLAMNAGLFLTHALLRKMSEEHEYKITLAALGHQTELTDAHRLQVSLAELGHQTDIITPTMVPGDLMELLPLDPNRMSAAGRFGGQDGRPQPHSSTPHPINNFSWHSVDGRTSHPVTPKMVAAYKQAPQATLKHVFLTRDEEDSFAFRVTSINFSEHDIVYSVLFIDDIEEVAFPSETFYEMIIEMELVDG